VYKDHISSGHSSYSVEGRELKQSHLLSTSSNMCTIFSFRRVFEVTSLYVSVYEAFLRGDTKIGYSPICHVTPNNLLL
jgi:hypothetical protein